MEFRFDDFEEKRSYKPPTRNREIGNYRPIPAKEFANHEEWKEHALAVLAEGFCPLCPSLLDDDNVCGSGAKWDVKTAREIGKVPSCPFPDPDLESEPYATSEATPVDIVNYVAKRYGRIPARGDTVTVQLQNGEVISVAIKDQIEKFRKLYGGDECS